MNQQLNSNIWKFYLFKIFSSLEFTIAIFVLFLLSNNLNMTQVMILESIFTIIIFFAEIPSGGFADRFGRRTSLVIAQLLGAISWFIFGLGSTFAIFLIAQVLCGLLWAFKSGSDEAFLYDTLKALKKEKSFSKIYGKVNSFEMFTFGSLAFLSSILSYYLGFRALFFITGGFMFIAAIIAITFKEPPISKHLQEKNYFKHLGEAIHFSFTHNWVRTLIIYSGSFAAVSHLVYFIIQPYYDRGSLRLLLGLGMMIYFFAASIGSLCSHYFIEKINEKKLLILMLVFSIISFIGMYLVNVYLSFVFLFVISFVSGVRGIASSKFLNKHIESHHRATVISVNSMMKSIVYAILAPLLGWAVDIYTPVAAFLMMGIGLFILLIVIMIMFRRLK